MPAQEREYFYLIDESGRLFHDGTQLTDPKFLDFFYRRLKTNDTGRHEGYAFLSPCGPELNFVRAADRPLLFTRIDDLRLFYAPSLFVDLAPDRLRFSEGGRILHPAPVGGLAPLSTGLTLELAPHLHGWGDYYALDTRGLATYGWQKPHRELVLEPEREPRGRLLRPSEQNACFGCGAGHASGLGLTFLFVEGGSETAVDTWLTPEARLQGSHGRVHGGFISLLLDEAMGKVLSGLGVAAPTANLAVNFRRPVQVGQRVHLRGALVEQQGRKYRLRATIRDAAEQNGPGATSTDSLRAPSATAESSTLLAEAEGLFIAPRASP